MITKTKLFVVTLAFLFNAGCAGKLEDTKEIYRVIFEKVEFPGDRIYLKSSVISPDTKITRQSDLEYYRAFKFINNSEVHEEGHFEGLKIRFVGEKELKAVFTNGCEQNWKNFHNKYPEAVTLFGVSHIGFSKDSRRAIVYLEGISGCSDSQGVLFNFEKTNGEWKVVDFVTLWTS